MKIILSVNGSKGGTGKTIVSTAIIDFCIYKNKTVTLIEGDTANPDCYKVYENEIESHSVQMDNKEGFMTLASIIHKTNKDCIVINNPARSEAWLQFGGFIFDNLIKLDASIFTFWIANRQPDCIELLTDYYEVYSQHPIIFTMNEYWGPPAKFEIWQESNIRKSILASGGGEIVFPDIADRVAHIMRKNRMKWSDIGILDFGELIEAERCRNAFYASFSPLFD